jgi:hypothetical protein
MKEGAGVPAKGKVTPPQEQATAHLDHRQNFQIRIEKRPPPPFAKIRSGNAK